MYTKSRVFFNSTISISSEGRGEIFLILFLLLVKALLLNFFFLGLLVKSLLSFRV